MVSVLRLCGEIEMKKRTLIWLLMVLGAVGLLCAQDGDEDAREEVRSTGKGKIVYVIPIKGDIDSALPFFVRRGIIAAERADADVIVIEITTFGGRVDAAVEIRDALIESPKKTYALVYRAASAGALISLACDEIYMIKGSTIGAALPITIAPGGASGGATAAEQKYIDYLKSEFRATAERKGHPIELAEAMVDPEIEIEDVIEKGHLLVLTAEEALNLNLAEGSVTSRSEFRELIGLGDAKEIEASLTSAEKIARGLTDIRFSWILLLIGMVALMSEFKTPSFGIIGSIGIVALGLFFWGSYIAQLSGYIEIVLFAIGVGLLALEIFVVPGFGITGVSGLALILVSIFLAMFKLPPSGFEFNWMRIDDAIRNMAFLLIGMVVVMFFIIKHLPKSGMWKILSLQRELSAEAGYVSGADDLKDLIGKVGRAQSILRPTGIVVIDGKRINATTEGNFIEPSSSIKVVDVTSSQVIVEQDK